MRADSSGLTPISTCSSLQRIDVFLAAQQHARAARQDQRVLAEERRESPSRIARLSSVSRM